jgi:hypothetical protein
MSCREVEGAGPLDSGNVPNNVVPLQPAGSNGARGNATAAREVAALDPAFPHDAITRDGLELLKAFFAIDDAAARAALVLLAQRLARQNSGKR